MRDYKLLGHPTVLIFNEQGQEVTRLLGPQKRETIEITLQQLLKSNLEVPKQ
jgi:thiol:disulfide interchange protein